ncbi:MAG: hypothetical protein R8K46_10705 [Mariprofundaceae bacterium]
MKKTILLLIVVLSGCSGKPTPIPEADMADAKVFVTRCGSCHVAPHPKRLDFTDWQHMLKVMESQMQHRGMKPLAADERQAILGYLGRNAR